MIRFKKYVILLFLVVALVALAIPKLLSTSYVKERVAGQLAQITGRAIALNGGSSISLSPYLSVSYDNVTIGKESSDSKAFIVMDSLRAKLGIFSALTGNAQLTELEMVRPRFNLHTNSNGESNWHITQGPLADRLALVPGEEPKPLALGKIMIINGIAKIENELLRESHAITDINGSFSWPNINAAGAFDFSSVWRGENVQLSVTLDSPFEAIKGGKSAITLSVSSKPLTFNFEGDIDTLEGISKGQVTANSPSVRRFTEWLGHPIIAGQILSPASIEGEVIASTKALEFPATTVTVGAHEGTGRLQLKLDGHGKPALSGTLAFKTITFPEYLFLSEQGKENEGSIVDFSFLKDFNLDLRLSANTALTPTLDITNLAAAIIVRDGKANFDIGQAELLGGTLSGSLAIQLESDGETLASNLAFAGVDLEKLIHIFGKSDIVLNGKGDANLKFKTTGNSISMMVKRLNGEGEIRGQDGSIGGIDLPKLFNQAQTERRAIWRIIDGTTSYQELKIGFFIANGTAFLRGSKMIGNTLIVSLGGQAELTQGSLALRGKIQAKTEEDQSVAKNAMSFFIGGTSSAPLIVPLPNN